MKPFLNITGNINSRTLYEVGDFIYCNYDDAVKAIDRGEGKVIVIEGEEFGIIDTICDTPRGKRTMVKGKSCGVAWNKVKEL